MVRVIPGSRVEQLGWLDTSLILPYAAVQIGNITAWGLINYKDTKPLKVHKNENFFGFDFEFCPISLLVMHK